MPDVTLSGNEITDAVRAAAIAGDGRWPDDESFGIWEATTNLITNGGIETDVTGFVVNGDASRSRITSQAKFGSACLEIVANGTAADEGAYHAFAGVAATEYTMSVWVRGTGGGTIHVALWDDVSGFQVSAAHTLTTTWTRLTVTATTGGGAVTFRLYIKTNVGQNITWQADGVQVEAQPAATPYVETDGGTAGRVAARVQVPVNGLDGLDETQSWVAFRIRPGWNTGDTFTDHPRFFAWYDDATHYIQVWYRDQGNDRWVIERNNGGAADTLWHSATLVVKDVPITIIAAWTAAGVFLSVDGAAFETTAGTDIPTLAAIDADLGTRQVGQHVNSDFLWFACGTGPITDAQAAALASLGNLDDLEAHSEFDAVMQPTLLWKARTANYYDSFPTQQPYHRAARSGLRLARRVARND